MRPAKNNLKMRFVVNFFLIFNLGCTVGHKDNKYSQVRTLMATYVKVDACREGRSEEYLELVYSKVWKRLEDIAWRMNVFDERSDVTKVNHSFQAPVTVGEDTYRLIHDSIVISGLTHGAFDITVRPIIKLWKESEVKQSLPSSEEIQQVLNSVGSRQIAFLANNQIQLFHPSASIDLGGIAKGYAADEAAKIFRENGIENFLIAVAGDIYAGGVNCHGKPWRIGIRDPRDTSKLIDFILISNMAVSTSGDYEQFFKINGQQWSHIINPLTGYPQKDVSSATVITSKGAEADALATALTVLGAKQGTQLIDSFKGQYASVIINKEGQEGIVQYKSERFKEFQDPKQ